MNKKVIEKLEFNKILKMLEDHAASLEARKLCLETGPLGSQAEIEHRLQNVADAVDRIFKDGSISFGGINGHSDNTGSSLCHKVVWNEGPV